MSRLFYAGAVGVAALWCSAAPRAQGAMTVDQIVSRHQEARGGVERLRALQATRVTGRVRVQGLDGTFTAIAKRPNLLRQDITLGNQSVVTAFDGAAAWTINTLTGSSTPIVLGGPDAEAIRLQAEFDTPLFDASARGYTVALAGTETIAGKRLFHLVITARGLPDQHCYLDSQTFLETRITIMMAGAALDQEPGDYRTVDGLRFPFSVRSRSGGVVLSELMLERVELNPVVDAAVFKIPAR